MHEHHPTTGAPSVSSVGKTASVILALTFAALIICWLTPPAEQGNETGVSMELPYHVGSLYGFSEEVSPAELAILPKDTTFARKTFGAADSDRLDRVECSIVLSGAERRSIHRPERCLPAQGWRIDRTHTETIPLASGHLLRTTALLLEKHVTLANGQPFTLRQYFLYWFVGSNITTPYQTERILLTNWDLLVHRQNQRWAYVYVAAKITRDFRPDGLDENQVMDMLKQFIHDSVPAFMKSEMPSATASR